MPLTDSQITEGLRLAGEATPGPWQWFYEDPSMPQILGNDDYAGAGHVLTTSVCKNCEARRGRCWQVLCKPCHKARKAKKAA